MSTGKHRDGSKERYWRTKIRQWQQSGLSVRAFCQEHDLAEPSFYGWRRVLQQRNAQAVRFVPVEVVTEAAADSRATAEARLELVLGDGRLLRIGPGFDGPTLQRLLALLREDHA